MDLRNLPLSENIEDRRYDKPQEPSRADVLLSLMKGLFKAPPPPLDNRVETFNGDPNMQYGDTKLPPLGSPYAGVPSAPPMNLADYVKAARPHVADIMSRGGSLVRR